VIDTARWTAYYRALESERPDAIFRDPYARRLAGKRAEDVIRRIPRARASSWGIVLRTAVIDQEILEAVNIQQVDTVLNLACGLDTRPFRLPLPSSLTWIEVDLPETIAYKQSIPTNDRSACRLESIGLDLSDSAARRKLFTRVDRMAHRVLVLTEGFLLYLAADAVAALARDLHAFQHFSCWMTDVTSPLLLRMHQVFGRPVQRWVSPMRFAPRDHRAFFERCGWTIRGFRPPAAEGARYHREPPFALLLRTSRVALRGKWRDAFRDSSGVLLLERSSQPEPVLPGA
jgi:methyltransferase (TIGR00027 family)